jgi:hypothetical protein
MAAYRDLGLSAVSLRCSTSWGRCSPRTTTGTAAVAEVEQLSTGDKKLTGVVLRFDNGGAMRAEVDGDEITVTAVKPDQLRRTSGYVLNSAEGRSVCGTGGHAAAILWMIAHAPRLLDCERLHATRSQL